MQRPLIICLTPVRDEAWILERFLKCASMWADRIIVSDQGSADGSREIARCFPKVTLIDNTSQDYNVPARREALLAEARRTVGPKVLLAVDADEFLSANFLVSPEWKTIVDAAPGTVINFQWAFVRADMSDLTYSYYPTAIPAGFVDDGSEYECTGVHDSRLPSPAWAPVLAPAQIKLMHYCQYDRDRFLSRIRWYQCYEHITVKKRPIELYRFYQQDLFGPSSVVEPLPRQWIQGYEEQGIDMSSVTRQPSYYWDREVLRFFEKYGTAKFKRLAVWDTNWDQIYRLLHSKDPEQPLADPRSAFDKLVQRWLKATQRDWSLGAPHRPGRKLAHKWVQRALRLIGW